MGRISDAWNALMGKPIYMSLPSVGLLEIGPEDKLLLECDQHLSKQQSAALRDYLGAWLAGDDKVAVITNGIRLIAVRKS